MCMQCVLNLALELSCFFESFFLAQCYELIRAGLFLAREKWKTMIAQDGPKADTSDFQAQINAGLKASMKEGKANLRCKSPVCQA